MMSSCNYGEDIPYDVIPESLNADEKRGVWDTAIGLQAVDGLLPSEQLLELAEKNIRGEVSYHEVDQKIASYYLSADKTEIEKHREADIVSSKIAQILESGKNTKFELNKKCLASIHYALFKDVFSDELIVGRFRKVNISKSEPILNGKSVKYGDYNMISIALDMTLTDEAVNFYPKHEGLVPGMVTDQGIRHIASFTSELWQIHPFREGNTRTTAVFIQLYLQSLGFDINNKPFKHNSLFFRNALVRSCYAEPETGVVCEPAFLIGFYENLLNNAKNELNNDLLDLSKTLPHDITGV